MRINSLPTSISASTAQKQVYSKSLTSPLIAAAAIGLTGSSVLNPAQASSSALLSLPAPTPNGTCRIIGTEDASNPFEGLTITSYATPEGCLAKAKEEEYNLCAKNPPWPMKRITATLDGKGIYDENCPEKK